MAAQHILLVRGLKLPNKRAYLRALDVWIALPQLEFDDALLVAHAKRLGSVGLCSYDTDFDRVLRISRQEPQP